MWNLFNQSFKQQPITSAQVRERYVFRPAFSQHLSIMEYLPEYGFYLLEDGFSVGAVYEVTAVACDGKTLEYKQSLLQSIQKTLQNQIPEHEVPWILQWYVNYEPGLEYIANEIEQYAQKNKYVNNDYARFYQQQVLQPHLQRLSNPRGLFQDELVTNNQFKGQKLRICLVLYRRYPTQKSQKRGFRPIEELCSVSESLLVSLRNDGVDIKLSDFKDVYRWLVNWFNPQPNLDQNASLAEIAPKDNVLPFGEELSKALLFNNPSGDVDHGCLYFDDMPHTLVSIQALTQNPLTGLLTAENDYLDHASALIDQLPDGSIICGSVVFTPQDTVEVHLDRMKRSAIGHTAKTDLANQSIDYAMNSLANGHKLYPLQLAVYLRARDSEQLEILRRNTNATLLRRGIKPILKANDLISINSYINNLPFNYRPEYDKLEKRSRLQFTRNIAALLPVYARGRGTGNPGLLFYNRGGEPFMFDPLKDYKNNAHMVIVAKSGSGKSAMLAANMLHLRSVHNARLIIIEKGNSHGLICDLFAKFNLQVNRILLNKGSGISLPPFVNAIRYINEQHRSARQVDPDVVDGRDYLGEMLTVAELMISGGDPLERLRRPDKGLLQRAIINAAEQARERNNQVLTQDIVHALRNLDTADAHERKQAHQMASAMELFTEGMAGEFFNRPGEPWADADIIHVEMGRFAEKGNMDLLTVAYIGIMNSVADLAERQQYESRPTIILTDEGHIITTNPLLSNYFVSFAKMSRKLGLWLWIATQNVGDFKGDATKILSMAEWWISMATSKDEVEQMAQVRELSEAQKNLMLSAKKSPGKYSEAVVHSDSVNGLFRIIPPPLALVLAMTEQHEKAARKIIMDECGCSELDAAIAIAAQLEKKLCTRQQTI